MTGRIICFTITAYLGIVCESSAQDPVFSQFYAAPIHMNPSLIGLSEGSKVTLNYRNQWPSIHQAYVTYAASYDQFFPSINSGFALSVLADDAGRGLYKSTAVEGAYSYRLRFRSAFQIKMGISMSWLNSRISWSKLVFPDQLDPEFGQLSPGGIPYPTDEVPPETGSNISVFDVAAGIILHNESLYFGLSIKHLNTPQYSFLNVNPGLSSGLPMSISLHGGAEIDLIGSSHRRNIFASPNFQFISQGGLSQLNIGTVFRYYKVGTGVWYRHASTNPDALIFLLEARQERYRIAYSHDFTLSKLSNSGGAHEISFIINFVGTSEESRYNDCFNLFR